MGRSSALYLKRKLHTPDLLYPRPWFTLNSLRTHRRPHVTIQAMRDVEDPNARLETVELELTPATTYRAPDLSGLDPDFL